MALPQQLTLPVDPPPDVEKLAERLRTEWPAIGAARARAQEQLAFLRSELDELVPDSTNMVVFGSLGRYEFTAESDVDWTLLIDGHADPQHLDAALAIERRLEELKVRKPGQERTFGGLTVSHDLLHKIGGDDDSNRNTTQRILLLLESVPLGTDRRAYDGVVHNVLKRYVQEDVEGAGQDSPFKVPRFLQNDIARYWRTVAVDFAYKRRLRARGGWALRTAKLRMSRKLIYAAGLLTCYACETEAESARPHDPDAVLQVVNRLGQLVRQTPLDIVARTVLRHEPLLQPAAELFAAYDGFLALLDDRDSRKRLSELPPEEADRDPVYAAVRDLGKRFQDALTRMFFDAGTPLRDLTIKYGVF
jgi:predicted nucleotidyltransferase